MRYRNSIAAGRVREVFSYSPGTGELLWNIDMGSRARAGSVAGYRSVRGYVLTKVDGHLYMNHRLIWLLVTGSWPEEQIDHLDGDRANNRWENLREASGEVNQQNRRRANRNNTTGVLGVHFRKDKKSYSAQILVGGALKRLGCFVTLEEAHAAYVTAKRQHHAGCTI